MTVNLFLALGGILGLFFVINGNVLFGVLVFLLGCYLDYRIGAFSTINELYELQKGQGLKVNYVGLNKKELKK